MSKAQYLAAFALLCVTAGTSSAGAQKPDDISRPATGAEYAYATTVQVNNDNYLYMAVAGNYGGSHGCSQPWYARSRFPLSDERTKAMLKIATSSFLSRKKVYVYADGCTSYGHLIMSTLQVSQN